MYRTQKTCLVVDDSKLIRLIARKMLEDLDLEIIEAASGADALDLCERTMPDALLVDWKMPGMSGIEFLERLRTRPGGDKPVALFCTSEPDEGHRRSAREAGANHCVAKPFDGAIVRSKFFEMGLV